MDSGLSKQHSWFYCNIANCITCLGFPLCFILLWMVVVHRNWTWAILFLVSGVLLTDYFDGVVARYLKVVSKFGAAADRLRDKLLLGVMFLFLILDGRIHLTLKIITVPLAVAETALLIIWFLGVRKKIDVSAGRHGKIKMFLLSCAIFLCVLNIIVEERWGAGYHYLSTIFLNLVFAVALVFAIRSFISHYRKEMSAK